MKNELKNEKGKIDYMLEILSALDAAEADDEADNYDYKRLKLRFEYKKLTKYQTLLIKSLQNNPTDIETILKNTDISLLLALDGNPMIIGNYMGDELSNLLDIRKERIISYFNNN